MHFVLLLQAAPSSAASPTMTTSARAARAAADAVFSARDFDRSLRQSLWERFWRFVIALFRDAGELLGASPPLRWAAVALLVLVTLALLVRIGYLVLTSRGAASRARGRLGRAGADGRDAREPWALAQEMAARGDYTDAAHALYRALLETIARRERVRLHPSKTVGDYVRDLRGKSSALFGRFRDFARSYETVVYGIGSCDRERYERLHALALPIVMGDAAGDAGTAPRSRR